MARSDAYAGSARGAAGAAADLARARARLAEGGPAVDRPVHDTACDVVRDITVLLKALRTYDGSHPRVAEYFDRLWGRLLSYFQLAETLAVSLEPRAIYDDVGPVFEAARIEDNPLFGLFADGVRQLELRRGLEVRELQGLLTIVRTVNDEPEAAVDDAVTLLWERDFPHVQFTAVDSFLEAAGEDELGIGADKVRALTNLCMDEELELDALVGEDYADGEVRARRGALGDAELSALRRESLSASRSIPISARAVSHRLARVDDQDRARFADELVLEPRATGRYFGGLLGALRARAESDDAPVLLDAVGELCAELIATGKLRNALQVVRHVTQAVPTLTDVTARLVPPAAIAAVIAAAEAGRNTDIEDDAAALIESLTPAHAAEVVNGACRVADARLRRRLLELARAWDAATAAAASEALRDASGDRADDLLALIAGIEGAAGQSALEQATHTAPAFVRGKALELYFRSAPHAVSIRRAERGLRAPEPFMRKLALEFLVSLRLAPTARAIRSRIDDADFETLELEERKRFYLAYAAIGGDGVAPWLLEQLNQRNTLGRAKVDEDRALAAWALGALRHRDASDALERLGGSRMTRGVLRDACSEALAVIGEPPEPVPAPPPDPGGRR